MYTDRIFRKALLAYIIFVSIGCGYFESDGIEFKSQILGRIEIEKQENDTSVNMIYKESDNSSAGILLDCNMVYYNPIKKEILAKTNINNFIKHYFKVKIRDENASSISKGIEKSEISESEFLNLRGDFKKVF